MEEQVSWKGQGFTFLVFGGIVFLCSIFFVLGMLVGHGQGPHLDATTAKAAGTTSRSTEESGKPESAKTLEIERAPAAVHEPAPTPVKPVPPSPVATPVPKPAPKAVPAPPAVAASAPAAAPMIYLQVAALEKSTAANKALDDLRKKGFTALISSSESDNKLFHVKVGPFSNAADAEVARRKLVTLGYQPIRK